MGRHATNSVTHPFRTNAVRKGGRSKVKILRHGGPTSRGMNITIVVGSKKRAQRLNNEDLLKIKLLRELPWHDEVFFDKKFGSHQFNEWQKSRKLLSLQFRNRMSIPDFQFGDSGPRIQVIEIIDILGPLLTDWQIAFWFISANLWLNGDTPMNHLSDGLAISAAEMLLQPVG